LEDVDLSTTNLSEMIYDEDTKCNEKTTWRKGFSCSEDGMVLQD
jgi:hypothetical protein